MAYTLLLFLSIYLAEFHQMCSFYPELAPEIHDNVLYLGFFFKIIFIPEDYFKILKMALISPLYDQGNFATNLKEG